MISLRSEDKNLRRPKKKGVQNLFSLKLSKNEYSDTSVNNNVGNTFYLTKRKV